MAGKSKSLVLMLNSKNEGDLFKAPIVDGMIKYDNKRFIVDQSDPILIKNSKGVKVAENTPCYICDWGDIEPSANLNHIQKIKVMFDRKKNKNGKPINVKRLKPTFERKHKVTPEMLSKIMDLKVLGGMIPSGRKFPNFFALAIGLIGGMAIFMILYYTGILT